MPQQDYSLRSDTVECRVQATLLRWGSGLAFGSGLLMALAAPPTSLWPLAWVALSPLWALVLMTPKGQWRRIVGWGIGWGLGFYGGTLSWILHLHPLTWMGVPWLASLAIAAFAWATVTFWGTVCGVLWAIGLKWLQSITKDAIVPRIVAGTALWCSLEGLRSLTPLDWSTLALTQSPQNLWILHLSQTTGQMGVVALLVAVNGLLAEAWWQWQQRAQAPTSDSIATRHLLVAAGTLCLISHGVGALLYALPEGAAPASALTIGVIQGNVPTREKLTWQGIQQSVTRYTEGYQALVNQGAEAVLTPEGAMPTLWQPNAPIFSPLLSAVKQANRPLWLGTFVPMPANANRVHQSLLEIRGDGTAAGQYNKVKLVPLGEYIPLEALLGSLIGRLSPLDNYLVPGQFNQVFETAFGKAIVGICYESAYSDLFRQQAAQGGEFILTASNNDPYPPRMMRQHHALDVIRAIETHRWAARVTNTGISGLVDAHGRTRWLSEPNTYIAQPLTLYRYTDQTLYVRWGNWLTPVLLGISAILLCWRR